MLYTSCLRTAAGALALAAPAWAGDPYMGLAREVNAAAQDGGIRRVAVLPFSSAGGQDQEGGLVLAERLVARLARAGGVEVMERTLLDKVLEEQKLGLSGAFDQRAVGQVGRMLGVDAIVTGTFVTLSDRRVEVHARLIQTSSARILGAATARVEKEWEEEVERLQSETVEMKARFWAGRMGDPAFDMRSVRRNPGSDIRSMALRQRFYAMVHDYYGDGRPSPLDRAERDSLAAADKRVEELVERCY